MGIDGDLKRFNPEASSQERATGDVKGVMAQIILEELFGRYKVDRLYTLGLAARALGRLAKDGSLAAIAQKHSISSDDAQNAIARGSMELTTQLDNAEANIGQEDLLFEASRRDVGQTKHWR